VHDLWALRLHILSASLDRGRGAGSQVSSNAGSGYESQSSYVHTTSGEESVGTNTSKRKRRKKRKEKLPQADERPRLLLGVVLCYLAALTLRVPVCLGDMHRWIENQEMPYLRAMREVPDGMRERLSGEYWLALEPKERPRKGKLYQAVQECVRLYHDRFGIIFPPVNRELLLARFVNELGLPRKLSCLEG
jgi:RNA polymerase I-specific transcription initiation factor RRN7